MDNLLWYHLGKKRGGGCSGGGGGGSLPPGVYWRQLEAFPTYYKNAHFVFKGQLYAFANTSDNYTHEILKCENGTYTKVATMATNNYCYADYAHFKEFNGKVHIFNRYNSFHYTWDGVAATATKAETTPNGTPNAAAVVNGVLYVVAGNNKCFKWNESTASFESVTFSGESLGTTFGFFDYNDRLYSVDTTKGKLCLIDTTTNTASLVSTIEKTKVEFMRVIGSYLYFTNNYAFTTSGGVMYKYHLDTGTLSTLPGSLPYLSGVPAPYVYNGEYRISNQKGHLALVEVAAEA